MPIGLIVSSSVFHNGEQRIKLSFDDYGPLNKLIKSIKGARWSRTLKSWHIPFEKSLYLQFKKGLPAGYMVKETPSESTQPILKS